MAKTEIENTVPVLAGWETVRLIGRGSFGAVYEIRKTVLGDTERCALKHLSIPRDESEILELRLEGQDGESITRTFTSQARSIVSEYRLMMQLNNCPNVVSSYDVEAVQKDGGYGWDILIRMELLTPLKKYLVQQQDYPETEILRLGREIANALVACRRQKILHRDIKPENIMVAADGTYKLGDFGIARTAEKTGSATAQIGTYAYMAPEVYNGEHYGALADQYSLGMVLYWLLNGRRAPFVTVNTAEEKETALRRRMRGEALPAPLNGSPEFKRIVLKCCAYDPAERFQSPEELIKALDAVGAIHESPADPGERRFAPVGAAAPDDPQTETDGDGLSRTPAPTAETTLPAENETVDIFHQNPAGAAASRPPATSNAVSSDNTVGAIHESPADPGERRSAPVGVGAPDDPQTEADGNGLSRTPAPTAGDEGKSISNGDRKGALLEAEAPKPKKNKKKLLISIGIALAAVLALILLLAPKGGQTATNETAETAAPTEEPAPEPTLEPTPEPMPEPTPEPVDETALAYENALALLEAGQYEEAIAAFEALGDYEDSAERLLEARYAHAEALAEEGKSYEAALAFYEIKDYRDSWGRCFALWGQITERKTVSGGGHHLVGLRADGTVVADGYNGFSQCDVSGWTEIVAISAGDDHTVGLKADGTVVAVGYNRDGECDVSGWTDVVAISAGMWHTVGLRADGTVVAVGDNNQEFCDVSGWTDVVAISTGVHHTVGLKADGTVVAVGYNRYGECDVSGWTDVVAIAAGSHHTVGLRSDGTVVAVGWNEYGQCEGSDWTDIVAVSAGEYHTVGLRSDGTVVAIGDNGSGKCDVSGWTDMVAVSAGSYHTVGLRADGTVVAIGYINDDQCDVSGWSNIVLPVRQARN